MEQAMNLSYGDLIFIELALTEKMGQLDLSMQCGMYYSELIGKIEYQLQQLKSAAVKQLGPGLVDEGLKP